MGPIQFDASIDLFGPACAGAEGCVRAGVQAIDGAGWISVEQRMAD